MDIEILSNKREGVDEFKTKYSCSFCNDYIGKVAVIVPEQGYYKIRMCKSCASEIIKAIDADYQKDFKNTTIKC